MLGASLMKEISCLQITWTVGEYRQRAGRSVRAARQLPEKSAPVAAPAELAMPTALDERLNFGENDALRGLQTSPAAGELWCRAPLARVLRRSRDVGTASNYEPADSLNMTILTMPDPHALSGMRNLMSRKTPSPIVTSAEVLS